MLIQNGADVIFGDGDEGTPIYWAVVRGHVEVVKMLLQNGADPNAVDKFDESVLYTAAENGRVCCTLHLVLDGADIDEGAISVIEGLLQPINERYQLLRDGNSMGTTLMSNEEKCFTWNLAFSFTIAHRGAAFKVTRADSFVHHVQRDFHGTWIRTGRRKYLEQKD